MQDGRRFGNDLGKLALDSRGPNAEEASHFPAAIGKIGAWLSLVERYVRDVEVASSNLVCRPERTKLMWRLSWL